MEEEEIALQWKPKVYKGEFKNDKLTGEGIMMLRNGDIIMSRF